MPLYAVGALLLAGCSTTMNKDQCRSADWRTIGYEDGVAGHSGERIAQHRKACAEHGVAPDLDAYQAGRAAGLREFCRPYNGYRAGVNGVPYYDSCPADLAPAFVQAYDSGRELYVRTRRVTDLDAEIEDRRREIARLEGLVASRTLELVSVEATPEDRAQALLDTKQHAERIGRLKAEIPALEKDRARYQHELDAYRATVASVY
jgi:hypothetical protein